jgi:Cu-Zn family superoxide dismutase
VKKVQLIAVTAFCAAGMLAAAQAPQAPPTSGRGGAGGGIAINGNPVGKAHADLTGNGITGTADFAEYAQANGTIVQVIVNVSGLPPGMHGMHVHAVGKCEAPAFTTAGGHFDPGPAGNMDADLNHPFHTGDLPNLNVGADGRGTATTYTTRFSLSGPLTLFDTDGSAIIVHANPDSYSTGTQGQGVAGGPRLACGVISKS